MTILTTFANQSGQIPLSQLDSNFATPITIGTTPIVLGQTAGTITGLTLSGANLGTPTGNLVNCTFPTFNQNTTGTATNVTGIVAVANGGTGATTNAGTAYALKGANSDITSLTRLTTALSVLQGGTGATTNAGTAYALKGANADITSITGLGTAILNIGSGQIYKDVAGNVGIGGTPTVKLEVLSTDAMLVPKGTTGQQPTGVAGYLRFNTTTAQFEGHNGTAWVSVISTSMPTGTRMPFAQSAAPTGWTQDTSDNATNRMLRVVNTAGNGIGGTASPILNNVVPAHTHGFSTGGVSAGHVHYDAGHIHYTGSIVSTNVGYGAGPSVAGVIGYANQTGPGLNTSTGYASLGGISADHTHSGTTDNGSSQTNWAPRYIDMIICAKS